MNIRDNTRREKQDELLRSKIKSVKYYEVDYSVDKGEIFFWDKTFWLTIEHDKPRDRYFIEKKRNDWIANSKQILINHTMYCVISDIEIDVLTNIMGAYDYAKRNNQVSIHRLD